SGRRPLRAKARRRGERAARRIRTSLGGKRPRRQDRALRSRAGARLVAGDACSGASRKGRRTAQPFVKLVSIISRNRKPMPKSIRQGNRPADQDHGTRNACTPSPRPKDGRAASRLRIVVGAETETSSNRKLRIPD